MTSRPALSLTGALCLTALGSTPGRASAQPAPATVTTAAPTAAAVTLPAPGAPAAPSGGAAPAAGATATEVAGDVPAMTLAEAIEHGRTHQPQTLAARARVEAARREALVPGAGWRPAVGALAELIGSSTNNSTATVLNQPTVDLPRIGATPVRSGTDWQPYASSLVALGVRQTLLDFGRIGAQSEAAEAAVRLEQARADGTGLDIEWAIAAAFYDVLAARATEAVAARALARARARRDFVEAATGAGMRPVTDRARAEADLARFEAARERTAGAVRLARMRLAAAVASPALELDARDEAPAAVAAAVEAGDVAARVERDDAALRAARAAVEVQRAATRALGTTRRPFLFATGALSLRGGGATPSSGPSTAGSGFAPVVPNYDLGLVLSVPLYEPSVSARIAASEAREEALRHEAEATRQRQLTAARQARQMVDLVDQGQASLERAARTAAVNADQAEARFRGGLGTVTEVAEAESLRIEAELQVALGQFDRRRARAALKRSLSQKETPW